MLAKLNWKSLTLMETVLNKRALIRSMHDVGAVYYEVHVYIFAFITLSLCGMWYKTNLDSTESDWIKIYNFPPST